MIWIEQERSTFWAFFVILFIMSIHCIWSASTMTGGRKPPETLSSPEIQLKTSRKVMFLPLKDGWIILVTGMSRIPESKAWELEISMIFIAEIYDLPRSVAGGHHHPIGFQEHCRGVQYAELGLCGNLRTLCSFSVYAAISTLLASQQLQLPGFFRRLAVASWKAQCPNTRCGASQWSYQVEGGQAVPRRLESVPRSAGRVHEANQVCGSSVGIPHPLHQASMGAWWARTA